MSRRHALLYAFCLEKASEALRNVQMADTRRDYEYWRGLEAKWSDLADFYCRDDLQKKINSPAHQSDATISTKSAGN